MRKVTVVALSLVFILLVVPFFLIYIIPKLTTPVPTEFVRRVSDNRFIVVKPPSWKEVFELARRGKASYNYITFYSTSDIRWLYIMYTSSESENPCEDLLKFYGKGVRWDWYGFLLKDNCKWLKTFLFNTSRTWYLAYSFLKPLEKWRLRTYGGDVYLWTLIYMTNEGLVIEFYNALDQEQYQAIEKKLAELISKHRKFVLLFEWHIKTWWYETHTFLEKNNIPYAVLLFSGVKGENVAYWETRSARASIFKKVIFRDKMLVDPALHPDLDPTKFINWVAYINGEPVAVSKGSVDGCRYLNITMCDLYLNTVDVLKEVLGEG